MKWALALVLTSGCLFAGTFGSGKSSKQVQQEEAAKETPPALVATNDEEPPQHVEVARIRVWADDDYRAQNVRWQKTFDEQLAYANQILAADFGVRLEPEYREWSHHTPGETLDDMMRELVEVDDGADVMTVVGLTSSLSLVSSSFEQIGYGALPGRYVIVRGYADVFERPQFERAFHDLKPEDREKMYVARRKHKQAAVLLHELGHNWGAPHVPEADTIMNATYSVHASSFDPQSLNLIRVTLDARLHREATRPVTTAKGPTTAAPTAMPAAATAHPTLVFLVDLQGQATLGGQSVDEYTMRALAKMSFDDDPQTEVVVRAAAKAPQASVVKIIDLVKAAGLTKVSVTHN